MRFDHGNTTRSFWIKLCLAKNFLTFSIFGIFLMPDKRLQEHECQPPTQFNFTWNTCHSRPHLPPVCLPCTAISVCSSLHNDLNTRTIFGMEWYDDGTLSLKAICSPQLANFVWHVLKPGAPEQRNTEHRYLPEHQKTGIPEDRNTTTARNSRTWQKKLQLKYW